MPLGFLPFHLGPAGMPLPGSVPRRPAADIGKVEGVHVDELQGVVAAFLDRRHGKHDRLDAEIDADV